MAAIRRSERDTYLLGGRRVLISDLLSAGLLQPGAALVFERPRLGVTYKARVREDGRLELEDGRSFTSPSRAATAAAGGSLDGWHAWRVADSSQLLDSLRQQLLDDAIESAHDFSEGDAGADSPARYEFLKDARVRASSGRPIEMPVRELISHWGARGRDQAVSEHISAALENYGLVTSPNFLKVGLETSVSLVTQMSDEVSDDAEMGAQAEETVDVLADVGLTLGNIPSANDGVASIKPNATFDAAITMMLLNDYSQLAVMTNPRSASGAVTWQSIARERHANGEAVLSDAVIPVEVLPFDTELIDALPILQDRGFVFVKDATNVVTGIVTTADVVHEYGRLATPFFLIGELDQLLRRLIAENFSLELIQDLCDSEGHRRLTSFDDLSIGDYQRVLQNQENWQALGWPLDRVAFGDRLGQLREARNNIMHFNPDADPGAVVSWIRNMIRLLKKFS